MLKCDVGALKGDRWEIRRDVKVLNGDELASKGITHLRATGRR